MGENNIKGAVTLKNIVANVQNDMNDYSSGNYKRLMQFAIRGLKELNIFHLDNVTTARLDVSDINTVTLPNDFLNFIAVGVPYRGKLWTFTENKLLIIPQSMDCGVDEIDVDYGEGVDISEEGWYLGYGTRGGKNDYYLKKDFINNRIILSGFNSTWVILKYISTGVKNYEETYVPGIAQETLIAYVHHRRKLHDRKFSATERYEAKQEYLYEVEKLELAQMPSVDEMYDVIYSTFVQTMKL